MAKRSLAWVDGALPSGKLLRVQRRGEDTTGGFKSDSPAPAALPKSEPPAPAKPALPVGVPHAVAAWIPTDRIGDILGLRGAIIQRIKQLSGAQQVHIQEEPGQAYTPLQATGSPEAISKVGELVQAVLDGKHDVIGFVREAVETPDKLTSHVLKRISAGSGAWIQQPDNFGPLTITGPQEAVAKARELIAKENGGGALVSEIAAAAQSSPLALAQLAQAHLLASLGLGASASSASSSSAQAPTTLSDVGPWRSAPGSGRNGWEERPKYVKGVGGGTVPPVASAAAGGGPVSTAHFEIPADRVKDVLGVKGRNFKAIKQQSGIQKIGIMDRPTGNKPRSDPATVEVTGTATAIERCKYMVLSITAGDQSVIGNMVDTMEIDQCIVFKFIGPKGQVISRIRDESGAYLEVRETPGTGKPPKIIMTGPPECCAKAREMIIEFLVAQGVSASQLGGVDDAVAAVQAIDPYAQYAAQAQLQEAQVHAQLYEAHLQAQLQEARLQEVQLQALQSLAAQNVAASMEGGPGNGLEKDLHALLAHLAQQQREAQPLRGPEPKQKQKG